MSTTAMTTGRIRGRRVMSSAPVRDRSRRLVTRRGLQIGLALLWLLDSGLQAQPFMFGEGFPRQIIGPAGDGQPLGVAGPVHWAASVIAAQPALFNTFFVVAQAALGIGLLWRRYARAALAGSVVWGLAVWWLGEGLGGATGGMSLLEGAPGAALLYAGIAVIAWPSRDGDGAEPPSLRIAVPVWVVLWLSGTLLGSPHAALVGLYVLIALWSLLGGGWRWASAVMGVGVAIGGWVAVQDFGEIATGQATDPNTGPLIVLLAAAVAFAAAGTRRRSAVGPSGSPSGPSSSVLR